MSLQSHVAELTRRHQVLDREIQTAKGFVARDGLKIAELKRRKLHLKDEIAKLQQPN